MGAFSQKFTHGNRRSSNVGHFSVIYPITNVNTIKRLLLVSYLTVIFGKES